MTMNYEKDFDKMKDKVNTLLEQIDTLVSNYDEKYDVNISNDLHFKLDEVSDMINDNYAEADFSD